jgi:hypothetical protein
VLFALLNKLLDDGNLLYNRQRIQDAHHRFTYAMRKCVLIDVYAKSDDKVKSKQVNIMYGILLGELCVCVCVCVCYIYSTLTFPGMARCKRRLGEYNAAIECCTQAAQLSTTNGAIEAYLLRAKCHFDAQVHT